MKTIKQIADELGVTKQAIRYWLNKTGATKENGNLLVNENGHLLVSLSAESAIKTAILENERQAFTGKQVVNGNAQFTTEPNGSLREMVELLKQENEFLKGQIEIKDEQIRSMTSAVEAQAKSIMAESVMDVQQKMLEDGQTKKGFFKRLFNRGR